MRCVHDPQYLCASFQKKCGHYHINERYELRKLYKLYRLCKLSDLSRWSEPHRSGLFKICRRQILTAQAVRSKKSHELRTMCDVLDEVYKLHGPRELY